MKKTTHLLFTTALLFSLAIKGLAQCSDCVTDLNCVGLDGFPAVCPAIADTAYTNSYYEEFLTFYIPSQVTDPGSGVDATLLSVEVVSVSGLPFGLAFTLNDADGIFYPSQGENYGCATICGSPLIQGVYDVQIAVNIVAEAFGFELTQSEVFPYTIIVEQGEGGTGSFSYDNTAGCGQVQVQFEAMLIAPAPSITEYSWEFGDGTTSNLQLPSTVNYNTTGNYTCRLTTSISDFKLTEVATTNLSDNWSGDIDDIFSTSDTYFILADGNGNIVFNSDVIDNNNSPTWESLSILLSNPPYTISFYDEDDITSDDFLGSTAFTLITGENNFSISTGTEGSITILLDETTSVTDSIEINVFDVPIPIFWINDTQLYFDDPNFISFQWHVNGVPLTDQTEATITLDQGGEYTCMVTNLYGCSAWSNAYLHCPVIQPIYDAIAQEVYVDQGFETYQWFFNGEAITGANTYYFVSNAYGNYSVLVTTDYGCTTLSSVVNVMSDIPEHHLDAMQIAPNPASQNTWISNLPIGAAVQLIDQQGRILQRHDITADRLLLDLAGYAAGVYELRILDKDIIHRQKLIKL
jgi:PKD repeat protein